MTNDTFQIGDTVNILHAIHLPKFEVIQSTGTIERITHQTSDGTPLYWIFRRKTAVDAYVLRKPVR